MAAAAATQILAANKMAANATMENNDNGRDMNSNAFTAAAMSNLFALDPAFKAFLNENDCRDALTHFVKKFLNFEIDWLTY